MVKRDNKGRFIKGEKPYPVEIRFPNGYPEPWNKGIKGSVKPNSGSFKKGVIPWNKGKEMAKGNKNPNWQGGKRNHTAGYIWIYSPDHPNKDVNGCVLEHRLVIEKDIGRFLEKRERVHHINGNRSDNRLENLKLYSSHSSHMSKCHNGRKRNTKGQFS